MCTLTDYDTSWASILAALNYILNLNRTLTLAVNTTDYFSWFFYFTFSIIILYYKKLTHIRNRLVAYLPTQPTDRPNHHKTNHRTPLRPTQHLYLDRNQSAVRYISGTQRGKFHAEAPVTQRVSVFRGDRTPCMMPGYTGHVPGQQDYHIGTKILSRVFYFKLYKKNAPSLLHLKAAGLRTDC